MHKIYETEPDMIIAKTLSEFESAWRNLSRKDDSTGSSYTLHFTAVEA